MGQRTGTDFANPHELDRLPVAKHDWDRFCTLAKALKIEVGGKSLWDVSVQVLEEAKRLSPDLLYNARPRGEPETVWDLLKKPFAILHAISHQLEGNYSDSPYPWGARVPEGAVRDNDQWLDEHYPDVPRH